MATSPVVPDTQTAPLSTETVLTVKKQIFDLDKMEKVSVEKSYSVPAPITVDGLANVSADDMVIAWNKYQSSKARKEAKDSITGADPGVINTFLRGYKILPMFFIGSDGKRITDENGKIVNRLTDAVEKRIDKKQQLAAIWAFINANPGMKESLREAAMNAQSTEEDSDDSDDAAE